MPHVTIEALDKYFINSDNEKIYLRQRELTLVVGFQEFLRRAGYGRNSKKPHC